jgi:ATP sulfurylase
VGPLGQDALRSVLDTHRLPGGVAWPMPILLPVTEADKALHAPGQRVALVDGAGTVRSLLDVTEVFRFDLNERAEAWFGADARTDARIQRLLAGPGCFVAGEVSLVERQHSVAGEYQLTPAESRYLFQKKDWHRAISFHTHSLPYRVHQHIQREALENTHADGLYVSVETGALQSGDCRPSVVLRAYQILLDFGLQPREKLLIGGLATHGRGGGARETVFQALCRKNLGFSHMIVGRSDDDDIQAAKRLFEELGDLSIEPVFFETLGYDPNKRDYASQSQSGVLPIGSDGLRRALAGGEELPDWFLQTVVQKSLAAEVAAGGSLLVP